MLQRKCQIELYIVYPSTPIFIIDCLAYIIIAVLQCL